MRTSIVALLTALCPVVLLAQDEPAEVGLVERARRQIVQLDLTVRGPADRITDLGAGDFELTIGGEPIKQFDVDRVCETGEASATIPASYLLYFDQPFLSLRGRNQALELSRELIPQIVTNGSRAMIVSNGRRLATFAELTDDVEALLAAVDRIEADPEQWDPVAVTSTSSRKDDSDLSQMLPKRNRLATVPESPVSADLAWFADLDDWRSSESWLRASMVLGRMIHLELPKAMLYFADRGGESTAARDRFVADANSQNIRIYAVGSGAPFEISEQLKDRSDVRAYLSRLRANHEGLAIKTGGRVFQSDRSASEIGRRLLDDMACFYILSFDAADLPLDRSLAVDLRLRRQKVAANVRDSILVPSESTQVTSQLLGAFAAPDLVKSTIEVSGGLIPIGFADGKYTNLVQLSVAGSTLPEATWELGGSLITVDGARRDISQKITVDAPHVPVVLEGELAFPPGNYELVMVARETNEKQTSFNLIATGQIRGDLPHPRRGPPSVGPIAVVQPEQAIFVREGRVRREGSFGRKGLVLANSPTVLISLVCHGGSKAPLLVQRRLVGETAADFPAMELRPGPQPCTQIRDAIPGGTLTDGVFRYEVTLLAGDEQVASGAREFEAAPRP